MNDYLEATADKFTFRVATDRLYTVQGVWVKPAGKRLRVGLADFPQQHNGDVAFSTVKPVGTRLAAGEPFAEIETLKATVELAAPVSGTIAEVNPALERSPEVINQSPYEAGWLAELEAAAWETEQTNLLDASTYYSAMKAQVDKELKS